MDIKEKFPTKLAGFVVLFPIFFSSLAYLLIFAKDGNVLMAIISSFITWISYSGIHAIITGEPLDERSDEKILNKSDDEWVLFGIAAFLFIAGMALTAIGLNEGQRIETLIGVGVVLTGYFIAHYDIGDEIV
jgi:amino acid transporter